MEQIVVSSEAIVFKPVKEVFEAITRAENITGYFVTSASGDMKAGETVHWEWKDAGVSCDVEVVSVADMKEIVFRWVVKKRPTTIRIRLEESGKDETQVTITETSYPDTGEGIADAMNQTQGWTDFLCSLKAWLYTGINLRTGKFQEGRLEN